MAEKKTVKKTTKANTAKTKTKSKSTKIKSKAKTAKGKKVKDEPIGDGGIVIVEDDLEVDQDKINEERRAYLEEARSQEASD